MSNQILYPNIIVNNQRNSNCVIQASQLNGGNLAQFLNLQAMRVVKASVSLTTTNESNGVNLVNEYDGSLVALGPGDVIVSAVVENASGVEDGSEVVPLVAGRVQLFLASAPTYNTTVSPPVWVPGTVSTLLIANEISTANLNAGYNLPLLNVTASDDNNWINCVTTNNFTSANPAIIVTMLIMNPSLAQ
jgi:hypothetical protein